MTETVAATTSAAPLKTSRTPATGATAALRMKLNGTVRLTLLRTRRDKSRLDPTVYKRPAVEPVVGQRPDQHHRGLPGGPVRLPPSGGWVCQRQQTGSPCPADDLSIRCGEAHPCRHGRSNDQLVGGVVVESGVHQQYRLDGDVAIDGNLPQA